MRLPDLFAGHTQLRGRLRGLWFKFKIALFRCDFRIGPGFTIGGPVMMTNGWNGIIRVGANLVMDDLKITLLRGARLEVGDRVSANRGLIIGCMEEIRIGDGTMIAEYVTIRDFTHRIEVGVPMRDSGFKSAPIVIGENVWIGRGACILEGITIGANSVIGANAVVTRSVPPNSVAVGVPARVIRTLAPEGAARQGAAR
ncbi:acyltransferase [Ancylobacter mangrovi]|uniref:acyltransferase n=1 Tax=Ancylobacter mangrovi TaxID=2972472 RepID=UPI0021613057|nr:acyltransferase [Ancylobacter mangrovi]MCS0504869.1 acyltransferase [Ancylobacter mangrovi]